MIEQIGRSLSFVGYFTGSKVGAASLSVTVDVYDPTGGRIATDGSAIEIGGGLYRYTLSAESVTTAGNYCAVFKTTSDTVDVKHVPAMWCVGEAWVQNVDYGLATLHEEMAAIAIPGPDGPGSAQRTILIADEDSVPIVGAEVWISDTPLPVNPSNPTNLVAGGKSTDDNGEVEYMLDPGTTIYVWCDHPRANFENPTEWTVS